MKIVGAVTIGQSPRDDVVPEMRAFAPGTRWLEAGALDDLDDEAIARLSPSDGELPLVTRLRDGRSVVIGHDAVVPALQAAIRRVEAEADLVVLLCSGGFGLECRVPLLLTHGLLTGAVQALQLSGTLAILKPHEGQVDRQEARWDDLGVEAVSLCVPAYGPTDFHQAGRAARALGATAIAMDCFGYTLAMKQAVVESSELPTLLVRSLASRVVAELTG